MNNPRTTRGYGLLEGSLARQRGKIADRLIPDIARKGRILDIGCGMYPLFLTHTDFLEKFGVDKAVDEDYSGLFQNRKINFIIQDIEKKDVMPFDSGYFDVVAMLAVFEHFEPEKLANILNEICRILKPGGMYIMTAPAFWTGSLLRLMAGLRLVSAEEIKEHKKSYSLREIRSMIQNAGFSENIRTGYFEAYMNTWVTAVK